MHILIRQTDEATESPFQAEISFDGGAPANIAVSDPFNETEENRLEWYFEEWLRYPFMRTVKAKNAAQSVTAYGETLFEQVFKADADIYAAYKEAIKYEGGFSQLQIEVKGSPAFHRLHWESLKDPHHPTPLAVEAPFVRGNLKRSQFEARVRPAPTLNVLLVVARPYGRRDVSYRTIARPLVEGTRNSAVPVNIDIVRPGTFAALRDQLNKTRTTHGDGYYQLVHFDLHGTLVAHETQGGSAPTDAVLQYAADDAFTEHTAYLAFDGTEVGQPERVTAQAVADLLMSHQVPIVVLNACQSAKQADVATETSLGSHLMRAGVQMVVAMGYSVTVTAAKMLMQTLYKQLFAETSLEMAVRQGRYTLYNEKERQAYFDQKVKLEDWMLPVLYRNRPVRLRKARFETLEAENAFYAGRAGQYRAPRPEFGFVGRDVDILEIERRLLRDARSNLLLLRGMGGVGKTTLLRHLMEWWQTTGFVTRVVYFGYDEKAWTTEQIIDGIGRVLLGDAHYNRELQPLMPDARQQKLVDKLRAERHLLVLDNLESITGTNLAVLNTLDAQEQARLRDFVQALVGGRTLVLLGSRGGEAWLLGSQVDNLTYRLPGLDAEAASTLAERILERYDKTAYHSDDAFRELLKLLDGYPLALEVVLANLQRQTPADVLAALQKADVAIDPNAEGGDKTTSIVQCIEYSHSNLSPAAQELLLCLAPFTGVVNTSLLGSYVAALQQQPELAHLDHSLWQEVLQEAVNWGLMTPHEIGGGYLRLQPVFPYFLKTRLGGEGGGRKDEGGRQVAIEAAFRAHYDGIGGALAQMIKSKEAQERQVGQALIDVEYENLLTAVRIALISSSEFYQAFSALYEYLLLNQDRTRLDLCEMVMSAQSNYSNEQIEGEIGQDFYLVLARQSRSYLELKRYDDSKNGYEAALALVKQFKQMQPELQANWEAIMYHQLGSVAQEQRQWDAAEAYYQQALTIFREFNDRYSQATVLHQLGIVAQAQRQWDSAEAYYQQALTIFREFNDRHPQATVLHQLGMVAQAQRQWDAAEAYYQQALTIYREFNDRYSQASTLHQLGRVAEEQRQWDSAEAYYQQALTIKREFNDRYEQAGTLHQLGSVAEAQRQWDAAEAYYQQALTIYREFNDRYSQASTLIGLGVIAENREQFAQAADYHFQAAEIYAPNQDYNLSYATRGLARVWQAAQAQSSPLAAAIVRRLAALFDETPENVEQLLREASS
ncbi:MAG: tetratricopeptide repeat protein [Anaerolineae bacterium]|nr:tetratricopeptide repeat protein [Anaerolineae bacterium]